MVDTPVTSPLDAGPTEVMAKLPKEQPLAAWLVTHGPLLLLEVIDLTLSVCDALIALHEGNRTSGALDPGHIYVSVLDNKRMVRLESIQRATTDAKSARAADAGALGVLAFLLCAGRNPEPGESIGDVRPDAPAALDRLSRKLLYPDVSTRPGLPAVREQLIGLRESASREVRRSGPLTALPKLKRPGSQISLTSVPHAWVVVLTDKGTRALPLGDDELPTQAHMDLPPPLPVRASEKKTRGEIPSQRARSGANFTASASDLPVSRPPRPKRR